MTFFLTAIAAITGIIIINEDEYRGVDDDDIWKYVDDGDSGNDDEGDIVSSQIFFARNLTHRHVRAREHVVARARTLSLSFVHPFVNGARQRTWISA